MGMAPGFFHPRGPPASLSAVVTTDALLGFCDEDKVDELLVATLKSHSKWVCVCRTVSDAKSQVSGFL